MCAAGDVEQMEEWGDFGEVSGSGCSRCSCNCSSRCDGVGCAVEQVEESDDGDDYGEVSSCGCCRCSSNSSSCSHDGGGGKGGGGGLCVEGFRGEGTIEMVVVVVVVGMMIVVMVGVVVVSFVIESGHDEHVR